MGLPRRVRLKRTQDFARVRQLGQTVRGRLMLLNLAPNPLPHNRYGIVTGKRLGGAVIRNRVRRLVRQAVRDVQPHLLTGWDVVIVPHPTLVGLPQREVARAFEALARQAGLFKPQS